MKNYNTAIKNSISKVKGDLLTKVRLSIPIPFLAKQRAVSLVRFSSPICLSSRLDCPHIKVRFLL